MSTWNTLPRAAFDLETTGRNSRAARIVTASVTVVDPPGDVIREHEWLADPGVEIPAEASEVHGITTEQARREGRPAAEVTRELAAVLQELFDAGVPVIAFNASYDFTVLAAESARYGVPQLSRFPVLDPYIMNKQVDRYRKGKRTLTALCEEYGVDLDNAHTSAADALATLRMLDAMAGKFPKLQDAGQPAAPAPGGLGRQPGGRLPELPAQDQARRRHRRRLAGPAAGGRQPRRLLGARSGAATCGGQVQRRPRGSPAEAQAQCPAAAPVGQRSQSPAQAAGGSQPCGNSGSGPQGAHRPAAGSNRPSMVRQE